MFSAVYQGGLFGVCGMMPPKYTGAVMTGQVGISTCLLLIFIFACCAMGIDVASSMACLRYFLYLCCALILY